MSRNIKFWNMEKVQKVLLIANLCLWIYFWTAFSLASYPFRPDPLGHPAGTGYTFWGHSIAVVGPRKPVFQGCILRRVPFIRPGHSGSTVALATSTD